MRRGVVKGISKGARVGLAEVQGPMRGAVHVHFAQRHLAAMVAWSAHEYLHGLGWSTRVAGLPRVPTRDTSSDGAV
jgi:hypothetical protein